MSAFASLSLTDRSAAAVAFAPSSIDSNGVATWFATNANYDARRRVTMKVSLPKTGGTVARVKQRIAIPVMDSSTPAKKIGEGYVDIEYVFPKVMVENDRLDIKAFAAALVGHAVNTAAVQNLEGIY